MSCSSGDGDTERRESRDVREPPRTFPSVEPNTAPRTGLCFKRLISRSLKGISKQKPAKRHWGHLKMELIGHSRNRPALGLAAHGRALSSMLRGSRQLRQGQPRPQKASSGPAVPESVSNTSSKTRAVTHTGGRAESRRGLRNKRANFEKIKITE